MPLLVSSHVLCSIGGKMGKKFDWTFFRPNMFTRLTRADNRRINAFTTRIRVNRSLISWF